MTGKKAGEGTSPSNERAQTENPRDKPATRGRKGGTRGVHTSGSVGGNTKRPETYPEETEDQRVAQAEEELGLDPVVKKSLESGPDAARRRKQSG